MSRDRRSARGANERGGEGHPGGAELSGAEPSEEPDGAEGLLDTLPRLLLRAAVSAAFIYWILQQADLGAILASARGADLSLLLAALMLYPVGYGLSILRWKLLLAAKGVRPSAWFLLQSYLTKIFVNNLLPSTVGGDVVRIYDSWRAGADKAESVSVIFLDRVLGFLVLLLFALAGVWMSGELAAMVPGLRWMLAGGTALLLIGGGLVLWSPDPIVGGAASVESGVAHTGDAAAGAESRTGLIGRLIEILDRLRAALSAYRGHPWTLAAATGLSLLLQANVVFHHVLVAWALGVSVPPLYFFVIVPVVTVVLLLPVTINGIGLRETTYVAIFSLFGVSDSSAVTFAVVLFGLQLLQSTTGAVAVLTRRERLDLDWSGT